MGGTMTERRTSIIEAATEVFLRYGFARTTMADIAKAAGLSRPTLYASFPDKAEVFRATIESMVADKMVEMESGIAAHQGFEAQLAYLSESWTVHGYDLVAANPDANDMFDMRFEVVRECYDAFEAILTDLIATALADPARHNEAKALARMAAAAMKGFKEVAENSDDLRAMIRSLVIAVSAAVTTRKV